MFTGLIEELGAMVRWEPRGDAGRLTVRGPLVVSDAAHGDSISVNGVCLTVVEQGDDWFTADVIGQTLAMSTIGTWGEGQPVNLERAASVGDRLGGLASVAVAAHAVHDGESHMALWPIRERGRPAGLVAQEHRASGGIDDEQVVLVLGHLQFADAGAAAGRDIEPGAEVQHVGDSCHRGGRRGAESERPQLSRKTRACGSGR